MYETVILVRSSEIKSLIKIYWTFNRSTKKVHGRLHVWSENNENAKNQFKNSRSDFPYRLAFAQLTCSFKSYEKNAVYTLMPRNYVSWVMGKL